MEMPPVGYPQDYGPARFDWNRFWADIHPSVIVAIFAAIAVCIAVAATPAH